MDGEEKEIRLAIVMNGGLSLAVWMGGVGHEIDLLRRASRVARGASEAQVGGVATYDRQIFDKWVAFCKDHRLGKVFVDVIAGTSAGGLNGTLLATAVARGVPLDPAEPSDRTGPWLRDLWLRDAAIQEGRLIRSPKKPPLPSVFDGEFFQSTIDRAFSDLVAPAGKKAPAEPVTLFVTATALGSSDNQYRDSFEQPFDVPDHRRLYRFMRSEADAVLFEPHGQDDAATPDESWWRSHVVDGFSGDDGMDAAKTHRALVTAARASASFPFAFAPVRETEELAARRERPPSAVEPKGGQWLADGGILDNAPFQPVLDAITRRPLVRPVRRLLLYVVPSSGTSTVTDTSRTDATKKGLPQWERMGASMINFPGESDLRDDIWMADDLLTRAEGRTAAPEARFRDTVDGNRAMLTAAESLLPQYRAARAVGGILGLRAILAAARPDLRTTLAPRSVKDAEELLREDVPWLPSAEGNPRTAYGENKWMWGLDAAERVVRLMARDLRSRFTTESGPNLEVISQCLNRIEAVRDTVLDKLVKHADQAPATDQELIAWISTLYADLRVKEALAWCVRTAADAYAAELPLPGGAASAVSSGLAVEVSTQAFTAYQPFTRQAPFEFLRLGPDVETPMVDHDATDPATARAAGAQKLYGTRLRHFAAFGLPDWRRWDWTAGRLDAQTHLARALITPEGNDPETARKTADAWTAAVQEITITAELGHGPTEWLAKRKDLLNVDDNDLLSELRRERADGDLAVSVVDAVMRALPHEEALDGTGLILNALLARHPQKRRARRWTPLARLFTRFLWKRKVASLGRRT
jgi:predicted acylesterase/phospholipase RssA